MRGLSGKLVEWGVESVQERFETLLHERLLPWLLLLLFNAPLHDRHDPQGMALKLLINAPLLYIAAKHTAIAVASWRRVLALRYRRQDADKDEED